MISESKQMEETIIQTKGSVNEINNEKQKTMEAKVA